MNACYENLEEVQNNFEELQSRLTALVRASRVLLEDLIAHGGGYYLHDADQEQFSNALAAANESHAAEEQADE